MAVKRFFYRLPVSIAMLHIETFESWLMESEVLQCDEFDG